MLSELYVLPVYRRNYIQVYVQYSLVSLLFKKYAWTNAKYLPNEFSDLSINIYDLASLRATVHTCCISNV